MRTLASLLSLQLGVSLVCPALADNPASSTVPNPTTTAASETTAWQPEPNGRGTFSLIFSCIVTLTLCVWSALHLNVPARNTRLRRRFLEKTKWVLYGIFAPELVVATAAAQFIVARWLKKEIEKDAQHRAGQASTSDAMSAHTWDMAQCWYAVMGGFSADCPWVDFRSRAASGHDGVDDDNAETQTSSAGTRVTITPEGIRLLSFLGRLPHIHESQIEDKSKADWMAKSIICVQAGWMVIQVIARAIRHMPVSLLEINTCGHVACALAIYLLWWSKPLDIQEPTVLDDGEHSDALALMYLCSKISSVNDITDIRCFIHVANERDEDFWRLPGGRPAESTQGPGTPSETQITTFLSIGSPGSRNPSKFLGFDELWSETDQTEVAVTEKAATAERNINRKHKADNRAFRYNFNVETPPISNDCRVYYTSPYTDSPQPSLRHSHYCRRALQEFQTSSSITTNLAEQPQPHIPVPLRLLCSASKAADLLRSECSESPSSRSLYRPYYFTYVPSLGLFLGETEYMLPERIPNFPPLENLGLGHVDIHRDRLRSVLALTAAAYGALHCSAWPTPTSTSPTHGSDLFPTVAERVVWVASSLTIAVSGAVLWGFYLARQLSPGFDRWVAGITPGVRVAGVKRDRRWVALAKQWTLYAVLVVFALARVYLVVEAFVSLRQAPKALYETPEWTDFLPHL